MSGENVKILRIWQIFQGVQRMWRWARKIFGKFSRMAPGFSVFRPFWANLRFRRALNGDSAAVADDDDPSEKIIGKLFLK